MPPVADISRLKKKGASVHNKHAQSSAQTEVKQVDWPPVEDTWRPDDLQLLHLVPGQILTIPQFWSAALCRKYVTFLKTLPLVTTPGIPRRGEAVRVNDRFQVNDAAFAESLWSSGLKQALLNPNNHPDGGSDEQLTSLYGGEVVGLSPNIRIYRYSKGQYFDKHYDDSNALTLTRPNSPSITAHTTWTLLLYLTSPATGCLGGETVFYPEANPGGKKKNKTTPEQEPVVVALEAGMALLHRHGRECMLHEGREVVEGEKWVVRSDLCVRR